MGIIPTCRWLDFQDSWNARSLDPKCRNGGHGPGVVRGLQTVQLRRRIAAVFYEKQIDRHQPLDVDSANGVTPDARRAPGIQRSVVSFS